MARRPRIVLPGAVYHAHSRGNRKQQIFADDTDRQWFMDLVANVHRRYEVRFYAVCLMGNHYHVIVETPRGNLSEAMRQLNGKFTEQTNARHQLTGHLFEGRFSSTLIERDRYLRRAARYLARNPVKAGFVAQPGDWRWSTYKATAGLEPCPQWLSTEWLSWAFATTTLEEAQRKFVDYVNRSPGAKVVNWAAIAYGSPEFEAALQELAKRRQAERPVPRVSSVEPPPPLQVIFSGIESRLHRDRLIEVAHVRYGYSLAEISRYLNLHRSAAVRVLRRIEKQHRTS